MEKPMTIIESAESQRDNSAAPIPIEARDVRIEVVYASEDAPELLLYAAAQIIRPGSGERDPLAFAAMLQQALGEAIDAFEE